MHDRELIPSLFMLTMKYDLLLICNNGSKNHGNE